MINSFTDDINPADFRIQGTVEALPSDMVTEGLHTAEESDWAAVTGGTNALFKELPPLRTQSNEGLMGHQVVSTEGRSFLYRKENRDFTASMRLVVGSMKYYITKVRNYKGRPELKVMDVEAFDNE